MTIKSATYDVSKALDPAASVFVSANAGAGKTSLLTNRVLSLLLHGVDPSKILCLTFTNAASAEMTGRIQKELGKWVMVGDAKLRDALAAIMGEHITETVITRARSLFARVLESPEGIRIQTIHGFCQSLLRRFPIEANISPHFTVMDARTEQELLQEARLRLFNRAQKEDLRLQQALHAIAHALGESAFHSLVAEMIQHKRQIRSLFTHNDGITESIDTLYRILKIPMGGTLKNLITEHFSYDKNALANWRRICKIFLHGDPAEQEKAQTLIAWFANAQEREKQVAGYGNIFLTQKGTPRARLFKKDTLTDRELIATLMAEQERVHRFSDALKSMEMAECSAHMLHVAEAFLALYTQLKTARALMDYDDLILTACDLLQKPDISPWVLFKLDGGIDHILVDEAQDTSPEQWTIIQSLTQEFFSGKGRTERDRSLFIVGDEKQSIYSFQGADPVALGKMQQYFAQAIQAAAKPLHRLELNLSFRSTTEVLTAVDAVFSQPKAREGLTFDNAELKHTLTRHGYPGLVEIWPLIEPEENETEFTLSPVTLLARRVAETIRGWIDGGTAEAGDIMILVRIRTSLVDKLVRALKKHAIPVAGHDRMALSDNLAVQDLMALGRCLLLPEDDLSLAALLKSPIFNLSEEQLFALAFGREKKKLWERLREFSDDLVFQPVYALLSDLRARADFVSPFELYSYALDTLGARRRFTGRMGEEYNDPIDEFLGQALLYERSHTPSLQGFIHWLDASDSEIKRDMEQAKGCVRIMTVHGAKGLQAPIVILPDTIELPKQRNTLQWYHEKDRTIPLWSSSSDKDNVLSAGLRDEQKQLMYAEYRRLLYVALTRAENRLYICGATAKEKINELCWYQLVKDGIAPIAEAFDTPWGQGLRMGHYPERAMRDAESVAITGNPAQMPTRSQDEGFAFLHHPPPTEPAIPQPLTPSRLTGDEPAAASPLTATPIYQRGTLIHRLLQYLPDIPKPERQRVADNIAANFNRTMPQADLNACIAEVLAIMDDPNIAFLFLGESLVEVPVAGMISVHGKPVAVAGQIDRLCIRDKEVWIVDFKSNRTAPAVVPNAYLQQMRLYYLLLRQIYPDKTVRCALVWTSVPSITILAESQLDETPITTYI